MRTHVGHQGRLARGRDSLLRLARREDLDHVRRAPPSRRGDSTRQPCIGLRQQRAAIRQQAVSSLPRGAITFKGRAEIFDDEATKGWFYPALSKKLNPTNAAGEEFFNDLLDSPLRVVLGVTPEKKIMYNAALAGRHMAGTVSEEELGARLEGDRVRMNKERDSERPEAALT